MSLCKLQMSSRSQRWFLLVNSSRAFYMRQETSFDLRQSGKMQLTTQLNLSTAPSSSPVEVQHSASSQSSSTTAFCNLKTKLTSQTNQHYRSDNQQKFATYSDIHSITEHRSLILPYGFLSEQISMPLFVFGDSVVSTIISMTKLKRTDERG